MEGDELKILQAAGNNLGRFGLNALAIMPTFAIFSIFSFMGSANQRSGTSARFIISTVRVLYGSHTD